MLVQLNGSAVFGVDAHLITIEVNVDRGIGYHLVGLPDNAIKTAALQRHFKTLVMSFLEKKSPLTLPYDTNSTWHSLCVQSHSISSWVKGYTSQFIAIQP